MMQVSDGKGGLFQVTMPAGVWARPFRCRCCLVDAACSKVARLDLLLIYAYKYSSHEHSCGKSCNRHSIRLELNLVNEVK